MTTNQAMVLFSIYRGTFENEKHLGTLESDLRFLFESNLLDDKYNITTEGTFLVDTMLKMIEVPF